MYIDFHPRISHINPLSNQVDLVHEEPHPKNLRAGTLISSTEPNPKKELGKVEDAFIFGVFLLAIALIVWILIYANYG